MATRGSIVRREPQHGRRQLVGNEAVVRVWGKHRRLGEAATPLWGRNRVPEKTHAGEAS